MAYDRDLAEHVRSVLLGSPGVTEKAMFGGLAFLVHGHLAVAAGGRGGLMVRVDPDRTEDLLNDRAATRFVMRGRELDGWLLVDTDAVGEAELAQWIDLGVEYARSLPPR
ncbi:TfoX/Sxy family protein [uncultured Jatrophihabitans sp.]|uniref:TfoX/Sxy family protein n=1 Tax=uncultured Jatrophihabitans sp. TaxID=1610747 RepID=UPI0035CB250D